MCTDKFSIFYLIFWTTRIMQQCFFLLLLCVAVSLLSFLSAWFRAIHHGLFTYLARPTNYRLRQSIIGSKPTSLHQYKTIKLGVIYYCNLHAVSQTCPLWQEVETLIFFVPPKLCKYNIRQNVPDLGLCSGSLSAQVQAAWLPLCLPWWSYGWHTCPQSSCPQSQPHSASLFYCREKTIDWTHDKTS